MSKGNPGKPLLKMVPAGAEPESRLAHITGMQAGEG
jgi:hypothetical protein